MIFVSGQLGVVPGTKALIGQSIQEQTIQALENIAAILDAAGSSLDEVVKTTIYLANIEEFQSVNSIYSRFFPSMSPARSTVGVSSLPMGALIEIDAIAIRD